MLLYHGSTVIVGKPEIRYSGKPLDFGVGFYVTSSPEQAERWARTKAVREKTGFGYVSVYEFDAARALPALRTVRFETANADWLRFVAKNRKTVCADVEADLHVGPVADDAVYETFRFYEAGILSFEETVIRLKTARLKDQWAFHTEKALSFLRFVRSVEVRDQNV